MAYHHHALSTEAAVGKEQDGIHPLHDLRDRRDLGATSARSRRDLGSAATCARLSPPGGAQKRLSRRRRASYRAKASRRSCCDARSYSPALGGRHYEARLRHYESRPVEMMRAATRLRST